MSVPLMQSSYDKFLQQFFKQFLKSLALTKERNYLYVENSMFQNLLERCIK